MERKQERRLLITFWNVVPLFVKTAVKNSTLKAAIAKTYFMNDIDAYVNYFKAK